MWQAYLLVFLHLGGRELQCPPVVGNRLHNGTCACAEQIVPTAL